MVEAALRPRWGMWRQGRLVLLLAVLLPTAAPAQSLPKFTNFVVDQANIIPSDEEGRLNRKLGDLQRKTGHQFAVATVPSLQGYSIEKFALKLANSWGVGRRGYDDGVLLLVAPREHRVRIEVGYGLEAALTNAKCASIIDQVILPRFKHGDLPGGIMAGSQTLIGQIDTAIVQKRSRS